MAHNGNCWKSVGFTKDLKSTGFKIRKWLDPHGSFQLNQCKSHRFTAQKHRSTGNSSTKSFFRIQRTIKNSHKATLFPFRTIFPLSEQPRRHFDLSTMQSEVQCYRIIAISYSKPLIWLCLLPIGTSENLSDGNWIVWSPTKSARKNIPISM